MFNNASKIIQRLFASRKCLRSVFSHIIEWQMVGGALAVAKQGQEHNENQQKKTTTIETEQNIDV